MNVSGSGQPGSACDLYLLCKFCKDRVVKLLNTGACGELLSWSVPCSCSAELNLPSPGLDPVEIEGSARDDVLKRSGLQEGIEHIFFELPLSQCSTEVSF